MWFVLLILLVFFLLVRADARNRSNLPVRRWNLWIGPKPQQGEGRVRFTLRRARAALLMLVVFAVPLFFVSAPPDEGSSFIGDESTIGFAVVLVCAPITAMAFISVLTLLFSALMSMIFRGDHVFDVESGDFQRR